MKLFTAFAILQASAFIVSFASSASDRYFVILDRKYSHEHLKNFVAENLAYTSNGPMEVHHLYSRVFHGMAVSGVSEQDLRSHPGVLDVIPDGIVSLDPVEKSNASVNSVASWGLDRINQPTLPLNNVYDPYYSGNNIDVYIVDTGLDTTHSEFSGRVAQNVWAIPGYSLGSNNDGNGHGTHVAGTVGGNTVGVSRGVNLYGVKVLADDGFGSWSGIVAGLEEVGRLVALNGRRSVVNLSLGGSCSGSCSSDIAVMATEALVASGIVVAVAAGNDYKANACNKSPAAASSAITVASSYITDEISYFSNIGSCIDLFAPGSDIVSACSSYICGQSQFTVLSGTSMATPHVAGVIAQILQIAPTMTPYQVSVTLDCLASKDQIFNLDSYTKNYLLQIPTVGNPCLPIEPTVIPPTETPVSIPTATSPPTQVPLEVSYCLANSNVVKDSSCVPSCYPTQSCDCVNCHRSCYDVSVRVYENGYSCSVSQATPHYPICPPMTCTEQTVCNHYLVDCYTHIAYCDSRYDHSTVSVCDVGVCDHQSVSSCTGYGGYGESCPDGCSCETRQTCDYSSCCKCDPGFYSSNGYGYNENCVACPSGSYSYLIGTADGCPCLPGYTSETGYGPCYLYETPSETPVISAPIETPVAPPMETPVAPPMETPVAPPMETPVAPPMETPVAPPMETPVVSPAEIPIALPTETPAAPPTYIEISNCPLNSHVSKDPPCTPNCYQQPYGNCDCVNCNQNCYNVAAKTCSGENICVNEKFSDLYSDYPLCSEFSCVENTSFCNPYSYSHCPTTWTCCDAAGNCHDGCTDSHVYGCGENTCSHTSADTCDGLTCNSGCSCQGVRDVCDFTNCCVCDPGYCEYAWDGASGCWPCWRTDDTYPIPK